ncbi:uncharacterized protein LOC134194892 isoform X2 [Corticium candelabrum]|uniref:uncharacterized protein LOC134194892 isoform X2 n=1 Tax=Corticium candelabrum TaxID=121492 RepID=UPI002E271B22|nr:uncharacterized protein LOC134194892 isoform X2 [Corticium candelabrum]
MASVGAVLSGGFEVEFIDPLDKDYECPVCLLVLRNPLQTSCGHLICTSCVDSITQEGQVKCPLDKQVSQRKDLFLDTFHERKILSLKVRCLNHAQGCNWRGELRHLRRHTARSGDCKFSAVECLFSVVGCQKKLTVAQCDIHEEQDVKQHMRLLLKSHQAIQQQNNCLEYRVTEMNTTIQTLETENSDLKKRIQSDDIPAAVQGRGRPFKASVGAVFPSGFEADFIEPLAKDYQCPVCLLALRNPLQTSCGHLICTTCADFITQKGQLRCPRDKQVSDRKDIFPDTFNERKILSLKVKCPHRMQGCYWTGELRHLQRHTDRSGDCKFLTVQCAFSVVGCQKKLTADQCDIHEEQDAYQHIRLLLKSHQTILQQNIRLESQIIKMNTTIHTLETENSDLKRRIQSGDIPAVIQGLGRHFKAYWVIDNWKQTLEAARRAYENENLLGRPYYIEEPGYRVCMQVYPNGFGDGRTTHQLLTKRLEVVTS